jgi:hypothetical protein
MQSIALVNILSGTHRGKIGMSLAQQPVIYNAEHVSDKSGFTSTRVITAP